MHERTDGRDVDLRIDFLARPLINSMRAVASGGRVVNVGRMTGETGTFDFDLHSMRRLQYLSRRYDALTAQAAVLHSTNGFTAETSKHVHRAEKAAYVVSGRVEHGRLCPRPPRCGSMACPLSGAGSFRATGRSAATAAQDGDRLGDGVSAWRRAMLVVLSGPGNTARKYLMRTDPAVRHGQQGRSGRCCPVTAQPTCPARVPDLLLGVFRGAARSASGRRTTLWRALGVLLPALRALLPALTGARRAG